MSEQAETSEQVDEVKAEPDVEKQAFLDRLNKESVKRKEAEKRAKDLEGEFADLRSQMDQRESAGLPELERLKKDMERAEKRASDAEAARESAEKSAVNLRKEGWVTAAAAALNFVDPEDALNPRHVNLDEIESRDDADRALKRLAKSKAHLIKVEEPQRPQIGRVLENGQRKEAPAAGFDVSAEAQMLADGLRQFASRD